MPFNRIADRAWTTATLGGSVLTVALFLLLPSMGRLPAVPAPTVITLDFLPSQQEAAPKPKQAETRPRPRPVQPTRPPKQEAIPKPPPKPEPAPAPRAEPELEPAPPSPAPPPPTASSAALPEPVPLFQITAMPRFAHRQLPEYPLAMRSEGREGMVQLEVLIDGQGRVRQVSVRVSAGEAFDQAAIAAMRASTFEPAYKEGNPVPVLLRIPVKFTLM